MKRFTLSIFALLMVFGLCGTVLAAPTSVELQTATSGVSTIYWGPAYSTATGGASAYVVNGKPFDDATKTGEKSGITVYAISNTRTQNTATEMLAAPITALSTSFLNGATAVGGPQLVSGTSDTVIFYALAGGLNGPGPAAAGAVTANTGNTLYAISGNGTIYWTKGIPASGLLTGGAAFAVVSVLNALDTGSTPYCLAPVTIDTESLTDATGLTGATIYGITMGSGPAVQSSTGVSIWAINAANGAYTTNTSAKNNVTGFTTPAVLTTGVSVIHAAPVISGNSLFVVGYGVNFTGTTIYQFKKNDIYNGIVTSATITNCGNASQQWIPTPCATGNSIFVIDTEGGVTSFRADNLAKNYSVRYGGPATASGHLTTGVTASPVTDGTYIVLCSTSAVTGYNLNTLSGNSKQWTYNFAGNNKISATPAISAGYVWVTVNDTVLNTSATYRFTLSNTYDGAPQLVASYGKLTFASPIIVGYDLWTATYDPIVQKVVNTGGAFGNNYWTQFKFDSAKRGANTASIPAVVFAGDDGGCFISTVK
jgi:hypothetical protein